MSKVTMPEPVAYLACNPETNNPEWSESCVCEDPVFTLDDTGTISRGVVFVDQAEAYADARVREYLEEAAKICWEMQSAPEFGKDDKDHWLAIAERRIRALIPPTE